MIKFIRTFYKAFDGTVFESEDECLIYEKELRLQMRELIYEYRKKEIERRIEKNENSY